MARGTIRRKGYWVKGYRRSDGTWVKRHWVPPTRIKDRGEPGKGPKLLPPLREGKMERYGYHLDKSAEKRHRAIRRSARGVGYAKTMQRVNALRVLMKNEPDGKKALADVKWMKANAASLGSKTARRSRR